MLLLTAIQEVQIPVLSALLLGGCTAKMVRALRQGSMDAGLGPTALFPMRLRRPVAVLMCALECGLGVGLIVTAGGLGRGGPANAVRLGTGLLFIVALCALLELRTSRPDVGCGCFGDFSTAPVSWRTVARSVLLAVAALGTMGLQPLQPPRQGSGAALLLLGILVAELAVLGALSPELGEGLVRLGYSDPCELRTLAVERTLTALRRSTQWRRHAGLITADMPVDTWRELCWRYMVFPSRQAGLDAEIVFAVYLRPRRPAVLSALVDTTTGEVLPWPAPPARPAWSPQLAGLAGLGQRSRLAGRAGVVAPGRPARRRRNQVLPQPEVSAIRSAEAPAYPVAAHRDQPGSGGRRVIRMPGPQPLHAAPTEPDPSIPEVRGEPSASSPSSASPAAQAMHTGMPLSRDL